jgi:rubrerythrin
MKKLIAFAAIFVGFIVTFLSVLAFFLEDYSYSFHGSPIWPIALGICIMLAGVLFLRVNLASLPQPRKSARTEIGSIGKNENRLNTKQVAASLINLAVRLEHATAGFFLQASKQTGDENVAKVLRNLATKELEHEAHFSELKLKPKEWVETPMGEEEKRFISRYVRAVRDFQIFDFDHYLSEVLTGKESTADVIELAIGLEKDSIVFYSGLENFIQNSQVKELLGAIIRDEFRHLSELTDINFV